MHPRPPSSPAPRVTRVTAGSSDLQYDNFEFVAPTQVYVVNRGEITVLDLMQLPSLTPRQINLLAKDNGMVGAPSGVSRWGAGLSPWGGLGCLVLHVAKPPWTLPLAARSGLGAHASILPPPRARAPPPLCNRSADGVPTALLSLPSEYLAKRICSSTSGPPPAEAMTVPKSL